MPLEKEDVKTVITQLEVCEQEMSHLNDWEQNFIESVSDQFTNSGAISDKQQEVLKRIYNRVA